MKKILLLVFCLSPLTGFCQKDVGGFIHGSIGINIPQGEFAKTEAANDASGYAKNGLSAYALLGHKIKGGFGMFGMLLLSANALDNKAMTSEFERISPQYQWENNTSIWTVAGFTFGPHYSLNLKKWAFDGRLMAGALNFISPEIKLKGTPTDGSGDILNITQFYTKTSSWAWGGGISSKYEFKYGWVFLLNADYLAGQPRFEDVRTLTEVPTQGFSSEQKIDYTQKFKMIMVSTGVGLVF